MNLLIIIIILNQKKKKNNYPSANAGLPANTAPPSAALTAALSRAANSMATFSNGVPYGKINKKITRTSSSKQVNELDKNKAQIGARTTAAVRRVALSSADFK